MSCGCKDAFLELLKLTNKSKKQKAKSKKQKAKSKKQKVKRKK
jgi:hypothetical protein